MVVESSVTQKYSSFLCKASTINQPHHLTLVELDRYRGVTVIDLRQSVTLGIQLRR